MRKPWFLLSRSRFSQQNHSIRMLIVSLVPHEISEKIQWNMIKHHKIRISTWISTRISIEFPIGCLDFPGWRHGKGLRGRLGGWWLPWMACHLSLVATFVYLKQYSVAKIHVYTTLYCNCIISWCSWSSPLFFHELASWGWVNPHWCSHGFTVRFSILQSLPSGKHTKNFGKSPCSMGKSTISMAIFNSYVSHYQRVQMFVASKIKTNGSHC